MKKTINLLALVLLLPFLVSCPESTVEPEPFSAYSAVLMSREQLEAAIVKRPPQPILKSGKIYVYGHYLLINEQYKGVHVIDNRDRTKPQQVGFIQVPGCIDFAVKKNIMYVDNAVDLLAIDLNDLDNVRVTKRIRNALPPLLPPDMLPLKNAKLPKDAVIVGWEKTTNQ